MTTKRRPRSSIARSSNRPSRKSKSTAIFSRMRSNSAAASDGDKRNPYRDLRLALSILARALFPERADHQASASLLRHAVRYDRAQWGVLSHSDIRGCAQLGGADAGRFPLFLEGI